jgi:hypothetical protein
MGYCFSNALVGTYRCIKQMKGVENQIEQQMPKHTNAEGCISSGIENKLWLRRPSLWYEIIRTHKRFGHYEDFM